MTVINNKMVRRRLVVIVVRCDVVEACRSVSTYPQHAPASTILQALLWDVAIATVGAIIESVTAGVCERCSRASHTVDKCYATTTVDGKLIDDDDDDDDVVDETDDDDDDRCFRCGRVGHWAKSCYARTTVDGKLIG